MLHAVFLPAHAFGKRYELPIPLTFFVVAGGAAVLLSFFLLAARARARVEAPEHVDAFPAGSVRPLPQAFGLLLLVGLVVAGFAGSQDVTRNITPTAFWLVVWIAVPLSCGLLGDWTRGLNPFVALARLTDRDGLRRTVLGSADLMGWPARLGWWPATTTFFVVACGELVFNETATVPEVTAFGLAVYGCLSAVMGLLVGADVWASRGEMFSVLFNVWGRLGVFRFGAAGRRGPLGGLPTGFDRHPSRVAFILLLLVSVSFDGLISTPQWASFRLDLAAGGAGDPTTYLIATGTFVVLALATYATFAGFSFAALTVATGVRPRGSGIVALLPSLLPIAFGYLLAHNLQYVLINGQRLIPLVGNPLGLQGGQWLPAPFDDSFQVDNGVLPSKLYWYLAVAIIVAVHVLAVIVARRDLASVASGERRARRSEYPWLVAMVGYTMVSLWLLAQPLVTEASQAAEPGAASTSVTR